MVKKRPLHTVKGGKKCTALPRTYYKYWCCNNSMVFGQKPLPSTEVTRWGFGQLNFSVSKGMGVGHGLHQC